MTSRSSGGRRLRRADTDRFVKVPDLTDVPSWRLLQELKHRGDLVPAEEADLGMMKGGEGPLRVHAHPVDRYGLPLYRIAGAAPEPGDTQGAKP